MVETGQSHSRNRPPCYCAAHLVAGFTFASGTLILTKGLAHHPDERSTACFIAPAIGWPASWEEFRDPHRSPLNPLWNRVEQRPQLHLRPFPALSGHIAGGGVAYWRSHCSGLGVPRRSVELMAHANQPCGGVAVAGRLVIAFLDTVTILLLFLLGRRSYGWVQGCSLLLFTPLRLKPFNWLTSLPWTLRAQPLP